MAVCLTKYYMLKIFLFVILIGGIIYSKHEKTRYLVVCMLTFLACLGLRHAVCFVDNIRYVQKFEQLGSMSIYVVPIYFEKDTLFYILSKIINLYISSNYTVWLFINGFIYISALFLLLKKYSKDFLISLIVFCVLGFAFFAMTGMRQNLAMACTMTALYFLLEKKNFLFVLFVLLASLFHKTSGIFICLYLADRIPVSKKYLFLYTIISIVSVLSVQIILQNVIELNIDERFEWYHDNQQGLNKSGLILQLMFLGASLYMLDFKIETRANRIYVVMSIIGITLQAMSSVIAEMFRLSMYFSIVYVILFANSLKYYMSRFPQSKLRFLAIVILSIYVLISKNSGCTRDYYFFWEEPAKEVYDELIMD